MRINGRKRKKMAGSSAYGRLASSKHFRDPRSWSADPRKRAEYLRETMTQLTPSVSQENSDDVDLEEDSRHLLMQSKDADSKVLMMKDKLSVAADHIDTLEQINRALSEENMKTNSEVTNLRRFVNDLILHLDYLKSQNTLRRGQMTAEIAERIEKIHLQLKTLWNQINLIGRVNNRFEAVDAEHDKLRQECHHVVQTIKDLEDQKNQLVQLIEMKEKDVNELKTKAEESFTVANGTILRERIYARENKISELTAVVDEKNALINELRAELIAITNSFNKKEQSLLKRLEDVEHRLKDKSEQNSSLLDKLQATELLAGELEVLTNQLKVTNRSLEESVENYKRQFEKAVTSTELMADSASKLQKELDAKKIEMEQQIKFPQNANTMLYFAHLNKMVELHESVNNKSDLVSEIKEVIVKLKKEMWGENRMPTELCWVDISVQTWQERESKGTDCHAEVISIDTQTVLPEGYIDELTRARNAIVRISHTVQSLESAVDDKTKALDDLHRQLLSSLSSGDSLMTELSLTNDILNERLALVSRNLKNSTRLLNDALNEVENEAKARQSCTNLLETVLQGTMAEYNNYVQVLLMCLKFNEEKLERLNQNIRSEMDLNKNEVETLTEKVDELTCQLANERNSSIELSREVNALEDQLKATKARSELAEKRSETCEKILEDIASTIDCDAVNLIADRVKELTDELLKYTALNDDLNRKMIDERRAKRTLKKILRNNQEFSTKLKNDKRAVVRKHRKSVKIAHCLTREVNELKKSRETLTSEITRCQRENNELRARGLGLFESLTASEEKIASLQSSLNKYYEKNAVDELHKAKLERFVFKLFKRIKKYKSLLCKKLEDKETLTIENSETLSRDELLSEQIDRLKRDNAQLSSTINDLRLRLSSLFDKPLGQTVGCQNDLGDEQAREDSEKLLASVTAHYESILDALGEDYRSEKEVSRKKFTQSLRLMKEAADKEVTDVRLSCSEEIGQIKMNHEDEMNRVKRDLNDKLEREKEIIQVNLMLANKQEIDCLKENHEEAIKAKEKEFRSKINEMNEQEIRNKLEHQLEIDRTKAQMKQEIKDLEEKHGRAIIRLEEEYILKLQAIEADVKKKREQLREAVSQTEGSTNRNQVTMTDLSPNIEPIFNQVSELDIQSIRCEVKNDVGEVLSLVPILKEGESAILNLQDGREVLSRKIAELQYKLASSVIQNKKMAIYERQIRLNEMKLSELASLLEQEVQHSQQVHLRLARQFNRSEMLQVEKDEMAKQIKALEMSVGDLEKQLERERDKTYSMKLEINKLKSQPPGSQQLEESLNRLKNKIDQAVECEKRLTEELEKEPVLKCDDVSDTVDHEYPERDVEEKPVIFDLSHMVHRVIQEE